MNNNNKKLLIITTIICLLPLILSCILYEKLPTEIAVHFNSAGEANGFLPKAAAAFGIPIGLGLINIFSHFTINNDPKKANVSKMLVALSKWAVPVLTVIIVPVTLFMAMGVKIPIQIIVPALVGVLFIILGNYLPKTRQSYTVGIKIPWTLDNEENWKKTHHLAGYLWILGGILMIVWACVGVNGIWATLIVALILAGIPFLYSYILYKRG